jgi:lysophospholipid acyltransferase (LPLAT)-like uncharacterized protein
LAGGWVMQAQHQTQPSGWYDRLLMACLVPVTSWLLRGLYVTLRPVYVQRHYERRAWKGGKPVLLAFWHGRMLYFVHLYRRMRYTALVSHSKDGEFISRVLARFGAHVTRGSSSRGGARGLSEIVRRVRRGYHVAFTPDGPRGPRYQVHPGVVAVAKKTGLPILPATYSAQWKCVLGSWDSFIVPLPFSRVVVVYGEPIYVPSSASAATFQAKRQEVEASLRCITEIADGYFRTED